MRRELTISKILPLKGLAAMVANFCLIRADRIAALASIQVGIAAEIITSGRRRLIMSAEGNVALRNSEQAGLAKNEIYGRIPHLRVRMRIRQIRVCRVTAARAAEADVPAGIHA